MNLSKKPLNWRIVKIAGLLIATLGLSGCLATIDLGWRIRPPQPLDVTISEQAITASNVSQIEELDEMRVAVGPVKALAFSPAAHEFVSMGADQILRRWDVETGRLLDEIHEHKAAGEGLAFSPDGAMLVSGGLAGSQDIRLWDVESGGELARTAIIGYQLTDAAWAPDGQSFALVGVGSNQLFFYDYTARPAVERSISELWLLSVAYSDEYVAAGNMDGTIFLYNTADYEFLRRMYASSLEAARDLEFSPDGATLASCRGDGTIEMWQIPGADRLVTFQAHEQFVLSEGGCRDGVFSAGGDLYFTVGDDGTLAIWNPETGEELRRFDFGWHAQTVSITADGSLVAVGLNNGLVHFFGLPDA